MAAPEPPPWHPPEQLALAWEDMEGTETSEMQNSSVDTEELQSPETVPEQAASPAGILAPEPQGTIEELREWV